MKPVTVFIIWSWDDEDSESRVVLQALAKRPPKGVQIRLPDPRRSGGDLLDDILIPGIRSADWALVTIPPQGKESNSIAFEAGLAIGFGKPLATVSFGPPSPLQSHPLFLGAPLVFPGLVARDAAYLRANFEKLLWHDYADFERKEEIPYDVVALLPEDSEGAALDEEITAAKPDWWRKSARWRGRQWSFPFSASRLVWAITGGREPESIGANLSAAQAAGIFFARSYPRAAHPLVERFQVLRSRRAAPVPEVQRFERTFDDLHEFSRLLRSEREPEHEGGFVLDRLEIRNFKNIAHLVLDFTEKSSLPGSWACIAGINGSGKSSILQALCMLLLGEKLVAELGRERLKRMLRRLGTLQLDAELIAVVRDGPESRTLYLPLSDQGVDSRKLYSHAEYSGMLDFWERMQAQVLVSYGASRNLSEHRDNRNSNLSRHVQRQMTLFDPLTQVAGVDLLLEGGPRVAPVIVTLKRLLGKVLAGDLAAGPRTDRLVFSQCDAAVEAIDLPDGFRSTVAWLADLCAAWHESAPAGETAGSDLARISATVLLDEIDLHLHPSLQRLLVPRLRAALPRVRFIVTTHSPLVLASFDKAELFVLDRDSEEGVRALDRQIFAFSPDQVYEWLMNTPAQSEVIDQKLRQGDDPELPLLLYQTEERSEEQAKAELEDRRRRIEKLKKSVPKR
jgi:hypothetical protein